MGKILIHTTLHTVCENEWDHKNFWNIQVIKTCFKSVELRDILDWLIIKEISLIFFTSTWRQYYVYGEPA